MVGRDVVDLTGDSDNEEVPGPGYDYSADLNFPYDSEFALLNRRCFKPINADVYYDCSLGIHDEETNVTTLPRLVGRGYEVHEDARLMWKPQKLNLVLDADTTHMATGMVAHYYNNTHPDLRSGTHFLGELLRLDRLDVPLFAEALRLYDKTYTTETSAQGAILNLQTYIFNICYFIDSKQTIGINYCPLQTLEAARIFLQCYLSLNLP